MRKHAVAGEALDVDSCRGDLFADYPLPRSSTTDSIIRDDEILPT